MHLIFAFVKEMTVGLGRSTRRPIPPKFRDYVQIPLDRARVANPVMDHGEAQTGSAIRH